MNDKDEYPRAYLYRRIVSAKRFIDEHFAENIDLENIADEAFFSKYHFIRIFRKAYKKTPHQYLSFVRIEKAKLLLMAGMPAAHVCYAVGFGSVSSFTGLFKRTIGQTPSVFRIAHQERTAAIASEPLKFIPNCFAENNGWRKVGLCERVEVSISQKPRCSPVAKKSNFEEVSLFLTHHLCFQNEPIDDDH